MAYAILRFSKMKGGPAGALEAHHERKKEKYESNPDVDTKRREENYHIIIPQTSYKNEINNRIENAGCRVRKDSIKFIDTIITASPEFFKKRSPEKAKAFFNLAIKFLANEVGKENIFSAVVHMDERTPHMHICFVPLTKDNRLCAKEIIGNRHKLVEWQDKFHEHMSANFPSLERGEPAIETKRKHIPVQLFKQATRLTEKMAEIQKLMADMNVLNIGKKREELLKELGIYLPKISSFFNWTKQLQRGNADLKKALDIAEKENRKLKDNSFNSTLEIAKSKADYVNLERDYNNLRNFIDTIPDNLRKELLERYKNLNRVFKESGDNER